MMEIPLDKPVHLRAGIVYWLRIDEDGAEITPAESVPGEVVQDSGELGAGR